MSIGPVGQAPMSELLVPYDPTALTQKVERRRRLMRSRLFSLGITIIILVLLYLWQRDQLGGAGFFAVYGLVLGISLAWFLVSLMRYRRSRGELTTMGAGTAIRIGPPGIQVAGLAAPWSAVAAVDTVKGRLGSEPSLRLTLADGRTSQVPLEQVSIYPATLDGSVRAFSAGRFGVDLNALDS